MYRLFAAAQAIEFSEGCHAKWSSFVVKSKEFPFASTPGLSAPARYYKPVLFWFWKKTENNMKSLVMGKGTSSDNTGDATAQ